MKISPEACYCRSENFGLDRLDDYDRLTESILASPDNREDPIYQLCRQLSIEVYRYIIGLQEEFGLIGDGDLHRHITGERIRQRKVGSEIRYSFGPGRSAVNDAVLAAMHRPGYGSSEDQQRRLHQITAYYKKDDTTADFRLRTPGIIPLVLEEETDGSPNPEWKKRASCKGLPTGKFFGNYIKTKRKVNRICNSCPVRKECLQYALETPHTYGVWGGTTKPERDRMKRKRKSNKS